MTSGQPRSLRAPSAQRAPASSPPAALRPDEGPRSGTRVRRPAAPSPAPRKNWGELAPPGTHVSGRIRACRWRRRRLADRPSRDTPANGWLVEAHARGRGIRRPRFDSGQPGERSWRREAEGPTPPFAGGPMVNQKRPRGTRATVYRAILAVLHDQQMRPCRPPGRVASSRSPLRWRIERTSTCQRMDLAHRRGAEGGRKGLQSRRRRCWSRRTGGGRAALQKARSAPARRRMCEPDP